MSNFILAVHYGLDHDRIEYVEMTQGTPMHVTLTKDPTKATHRSLEEAKKWANDILRNGEGVGTWKIDVMPLEDASIKIDPELQATIGDLPEMTTNQSKLDLKSKVFNALEVLELNESARTPNGEQFWQEMKRVIETYASQREIEVLERTQRDFVHGESSEAFDEGRQYEQFLNRQLINELKKQKEEQPDVR